MKFAWKENPKTKHSCVTKENEVNVVGFRVQITNCIIVCGPLYYLLKHKHFWASLRFWLGTMKRSVWLTGIKILVSLVLGQLYRVPSHTFGVMITPQV